MVAGGGTVLTLSASHGPLPLNKDVKPYDHTRKDPDSFTVAEPQAQRPGLRRASGLIPSSAVTDLIVASGRDSYSATASALNSGG
ncbi:hypothetical protein ACFQVA_00120 [Actinomadura keratinilytica]